MSSSPTTGAGGHESRDVRFAPVLVGAAAVIALVLISAAAMVGLFDALVGREAALSAPLNPLAATLSRLPPQPRLQADPILDLQTLRAAEAERLGTYSWVDREAGLVRIPIERAIELLAARRTDTAGEGAP